jgi:hypothetical protein
MFNEKTKQRERMMIVGFSKHMRNGLACKSKWGTISRKFKIFEYTLGTSHNVDY